MRGPGAAVAGVGREGPALPPGPAVAAPSRLRKLLALRAGLWRFSEGGLLEVKDFLEGFWVGNCEVHRGRIEQPGAF